MRAQYILPDLIDPERRGFFLSADELTRLASVTATFVRLIADPAYLIKNSWHEFQIPNS